ncbi:MAG: uracil-DNA glycosylase [Candidatus Paceibacterota bacterium]
MDQHYTRNGVGSGMEPSWKPILEPEFAKPYFTTLLEHVKRSAEITKVYPPSDKVFAAFKTPFDKVKVVILGQDPYHGAGQAHGLAFSVMPGVHIPPSLTNIYKEAAEDVGFKPPRHGCLTHWAEQGVLLLNTVLTVEEGRPGSHRKIGWEKLTTVVIKALGAREKPLVFILWGRDAQEKRAHIDDEKHYIIKAPHPSPLSAHAGFFGSKPFSKTNEALKRWGQEPIEWQLPENA